MLGGYGKIISGVDAIFPVVMRFINTKRMIRPPVDTGTSVTSIKDQNRIQIFPSPIKNFVCIRGITKNTQVQFYDVSGKVILGTNISAKEAKPIDCSKFAAGIYWVYLKEEQGQTDYIHKLVKQ